MIHSRPPRPVILSAMWTLVTESDLPLLRETIAQKQWGSHVIVVGPSPTFEFAVSQVYFRLASDGENPAFAQAIDDSRTSTRLRQIALEAGATYIDPRDAMCKFESVCKIRDGNELLYVDSRHEPTRIWAGNGAGRASFAPAKRCALAPATKRPLGNPSERMGANRRVTSAVIK